MKKLITTFALAFLVCATAFTLAVSVSSQSQAATDFNSIQPEPAESIYPSRVNNYCLFPDAVVSVSSTVNTNFPASSAIDGDRIGQNCSFTQGAPCWGNAGGWNDGTRDVFPDWLRVDFGRARSIGRVVVVTFQDNFSTPRVEPYLGLQVGNNYTIEDFKIEVLNTSGMWVEVAEAEENLDIIREFTFTPVLGTAVRITIDDSYAHYSRVIEFEAYAN